MNNHAICIPFPAQGHIRPMLKLAQLLHFKFGFHITFINIHQTLFETTLSHKNSSNNSQNMTPIFKFESLPKGNYDSKDTMSLIEAILDNQIGPPLKELLSKVLNGCNGGGDESPPPVTCMISDVAMSLFTLDMAEELGITAVALETCSGCGMLSYLRHRQLLNKGIIPLKDSSCLTNGYLDMVIDCIPSLKGIRLKDMPTSIRTTDPNDKMMNFVISSEYRALNSQAILVNTFNALEQDVLQELSSLSPNIYPIGPLDLLLVDHIPKSDTIRPIGPTPTDDIDYIQWLDNQEPNSILYVNFGTIVVLAQEQLVELAWGLANSHQKFFWVVRGNPQITLEFEEVIKERGLLASWCDQERVLGHPSIGGFVTHCGWNSMIESISSGVPMICWPFFAEQVTNSWYCCNVLGVGVTMNDQAMKRDEVTRVVKELMEGEEGQGVKKKALEWRKLAKEATINSHGSSYLNLETVVKSVLFSKHSN